MPDFVLQYDLSSQFIDVVEQKYNFIAGRLHARGYYRHQYSCFRFERITVAQANADGDNIAAEVEARFPLAPRCLKRMKIRMVPTKKPDLILRRLTDVYDAWENGLAIGENKLCKGAR